MPEEYAESLTPADFARIKESVVSILAWIVFERGIACAKDEAAWLAYEARRAEVEALPLAPGWDGRADGIVKAMEADLDALGWRKG